MPPKEYREPSLLEIGGMGTQYPMEGATDAIKKQMNLVLRKSANATLAIALNQRSRMQPALKQLLEEGILNEKQCTAIVVALESNPDQQGLAQGNEIMRSIIRCADADTALRIKKILGWTPPHDGEINRYG